MHPDQVIADIASAQHNRVARRQLRARGLSRGEIDARRRSGHLHETAFRGVYAVGSSAGSVRAGQSEALLVAGDAAVLTHRSGAAYWEMLGQDAPPHHVTCRGSVRTPGIVAHRGKLARWEVVRGDGLLVATPARVMLDLAETEPEAVVMRALGEAEALQLLTRARLLEATKAWRGRRGVRVLRDLIGDDLEPRPTRSVLEDVFLPLVGAAGLPLPKTNTQVAEFFPDALWPEQRVIVELDGRRWHDSPTRFERDRARVARLVAAGYVVLHFTWRRLTREPMAVIAELAAALARHDPAPFAAVAA